MRRLLLASFWMLMVSPVLACPFCSAVQQTLRQEIATMDAVVIAEAVTEIEPNDSGEIQLTVRTVIKGDDYVQTGQEIGSVYFGKIEKGSRFMLTGVDPPQLIWSSPLQVTKRSEAYLGKIVTLPDDNLTMLEFYQQYFEDDDALLAQDAYDEFAIAPYEDVQRLGPQMDHDQLVAWIEDENVASERRRLYLTMLGVCGGQNDIPMLERRLKSTKKSTRSGLDALIACYLTLRGADGLTLVDELFLKNKQSEYADTYAAIIALRFHGTETDVIDRNELVKSLHHVLERPELADLVIPDLARWGDWSQIDRLVSLFKGSDESSNWVRVPVINYLRACPKPEAKSALEELEKIDPAAVRRSNTFFPFPSNSGNPEEETSSIHTGPDGRLFSTLEFHTEYADASDSPPGPKRFIVAGQSGTAPIANSWSLLTVSMVTGTSLGMLMWLVLTSGHVST